MHKKVIHCIILLNMHFILFINVDVFCGDDSLPTKKEGTATSKETVHLKWCTPKTTSAPGK